MSFVSRWIGETNFLVDHPLQQVWLPSRAINVSDLLEAEKEMRKVATRVATHRGIGNEVGPELTEPLVEASEPVLGAVVIQAWSAAQWPILQLHVGANQTSELMVNLTYLKEGDTEEEFGDWMLAAGSVLRVIEAAGRRALGRDQIRDLAQIGMWLLLISVYGWFVTVVWPVIPVMLLGALAMIPVASVVRRWIYRRTEQVPRMRITVHHVTRDEWRRRRWDAKQSLKVGFWSFLAGAAAAFIGAAIADPPAWLQR